MWLISIDGCDFFGECGWISFSSFIRQNENDEIFFSVWSLFFFSLFFSGSFNVSVLISSMQRVFVVLNYYNYFNYACFCFLCVGCVCLCFVWFVLIHSIITRIKSKATKVELCVECFVLISLSIYSSVGFAFVDLLLLNLKSNWDSIIQ